MRRLPLIGGVACDAVWEGSEGISGLGRREGYDLLALALSRSEQGLGHVSRQNRYLPFLN